MYFLKLTDKCGFWTVFGVVFGMGGLFLFQVRYVGFMLDGMGRG
jgi:hypothetical protein